MLNLTIRICECYLLHPALRIPDSKRLDFAEHGHPVPYGPGSTNSVRPHCAGLFALRNRTRVSQKVGLPGQPLNDNAQFANGVRVVNRKGTRTTWRKRWRDESSSSRLW